jgi:1-deoxy-D-xylulose-5-phosphate reductoisomerase
MKKILILGATGSIGKSAIAIAKAYPQLLQVVGLQAHSQVEALLALREDFPQAKLAITGLMHILHQDIIAGKNALRTLIETSTADLVLNGIAGSSGLWASVYSLQAGKHLALANKESMVMASEYLHALARDKNLDILPVDSEHSALYYLMQSPLAIDEYIITASGGAFRGKKLSELEHVRAHDAAKHPTWQMGLKISIDSASLANKGLEVIEAWKFLHIPLDQIKVLQHPQSLVHALVRTSDGALQAYISNTHMQLPIQNALLHPQLKPATLSYLDLIGQKLSFEEIDHQTFPMLQLAYLACHKGDPYPLIYNAVNEVAVALFIEDKISFLAIAQLVAKALDASYPYSFDPLQLDDIWQADAWSRVLASSIYEEHYR